MILKNTFRLTILAASLLAFHSCEKKEDKPVDTDTQAASDNEQAEAISDDAMRKADAATKGQSSFKLSDSNGSYEQMMACATVTRDTSVANTTTVTIDFGTTNCTSADSRLRRGKIIYSFTGNYFAAGSVRTLRFDNYFVDDHKVEGDHTITFAGMDTLSGYYTWNIQANSMKITRPDGKSHTWSSTRKREMLTGAQTIFDFSDDSYQISGSANGTNVNGVAYSVTIDSPLKVAVSCRYIMGGVATLKATGISDRIIDFGDGTCDNTATVTIDKVSYVIPLH